jgi:hypothetical protein
MRSLRPSPFVWGCRLLGVLVALAPGCARRQERSDDVPSQPVPAQPTVAKPLSSEATDLKTFPQAHAIGAAIASIGVQKALGANASASVSAAPSASASPSSSTSASSSASAATSASAAPSTSAQVPLTREAALTQMIGAWGFSRFDLDDAGTKARWSAVPPDLQKEILKTAPEAWLFVGKDTLITRLNGVPEKKSTYTLEAESAAFPKGTVVVKTSDEGRKAIRLLDADTMRVEDLDKKDSFVTVFARKKMK